MIKRNCGDRPVARILPLPMKLTDIDLKGLSRFVPSRIPTAASAASRAEAGVFVRLTESFGVPAVR